MSLTRRSALRWSLFLLACWCLVAPAEARAPRQEHADVQLVVDRTAHPPGSTARLAAVVEVDEGWHVNAHQPTFDYLIPTELTLERPAGWPEPRLDYPAPQHRTFDFEATPLAVYDGTVHVVAALPVPVDAAPGPYPITGRFLYQACDDKSCAPPVTVELFSEVTVGEGGEALYAHIFDAPRGPTAGPAPATGSPLGEAAPVPARRLAILLLLAVVGGLILNAMPCVLPVLSLKVFGLMQSAGRGRSEVVLGSLATAAGIFASFWALAAAAVAARAAGAAVGWGVQFQRPGFVTFLAVVVVLFCLNLWGLFEIPLPSRLVTSLGGGQQREGVAGHFASGLFATLMATPCSAPFLGTAVGFALAQPAGTVFAIFGAVALGMSLPYLVLAAAPSAARLLPKPGAWMDVFRTLMGFLLATAAVWLFYVLSAQVSPARLATIQLALLGLAAFVWMRSRWTRQGGGALGRRVAVAGIAGTAGLALALALLAGAAPSAERGTETAGGHIAWVDFDRGEAERIGAEQLVFVDVTADWCFTCKTNERLVLETAEVAGLFSEHGVLAMKADWTNRDDAIADFLAAHGRYSIPFYLLYRPGQEPHLFSELLTRGAIEEAVLSATASPQLTAAR